MFKLTQLRPEGTDCTAPYSVELNGDYTVASFVQDVLKDKTEWGYIGIDNGKFGFGDPNVKFRHGKLLSTLPSKYLDMKVTKAKASGGWSRMDYLLTVEVANDVFTKITEHYGIRHENIYGDDGFVVYLIGDESDSKNYIAKFKQQAAALNECKYLERCLSN